MLEVKSKGSYPQDSNYSAFERNVNFVGGLVGRDSANSGAVLRVLGLVGMQISQNYLSHICACHHDPNIREAHPKFQHFYMTATW